MYLSLLICQDPICEIVKMQKKKKNDNNVRYSANKLFDALKRILLNPEILR